MKKIFLLLLAACTLTASFSQTKKRPAKKTYGAKKTRKAVKILKGGRPSADDQLLCTEGDDVICTWDVYKGDTLVYTVNDGGKTYDYTAVITLFDPLGKGIAFTWKMSDPVNTSGTVTMSAAAVASAHKMVNYFSGGASALTDASAVFMSTAVFNEFIKKKSTLQMDNTPAEAWIRPDEDNADLTINFRGKQTNMDLLRLTNAKGDKEMWVQNISTSPVVVKMTGAFTITLKEVR